MKHFVYIVECKDKSLYTGYTIDLTKRFAAHNNGTGAKYTRSRRPVKLVYYEEYQDKSTALRREWMIKQMTRKEKLDLIKNNI